jgi:hypothetical protein
MSDSVFQPLHTVVTTNKIYIERFEGFKFCYVDGFGSAKAGVITKLIDGSLPHFYRISGTFCYIMQLYRTLVTCSATENKTPGLQYQ